jgi:hypothetical protein
MFMHYIMHIKSLVHITSTFNIYSKSYTKSHSKLAGGGGCLGTIIGGLFPLILDIL